MGGTNLKRNHSNKRPFLCYFEWDCRFTETIVCKHRIIHELLALFQEWNVMRNFLLWLKSDYFSVTWHPIIISKAALTQLKAVLPPVRFIPVNIHRCETKSTRSMFVGSCSCPGWLYPSHCVLFVYLTCALWILGQEMLLSLLHPVLQRSGTSSRASFCSRTEFHVSPQSNDGNCSSVHSGARAAEIRFTKKQQFVDGQLLKAFQYSLEILALDTWGCLPQQHVGVAKHPFGSVGSRVFPGITQNALGCFLRLCIFFSSMVCCPFSAGQTEPYNIYNFSLSSAALLLLNLLQKRGDHLGRSWELSRW